MKSEKEKLAAKTVDQLKAAAKRLGGKLVTPDGKAKTKVQLINTIVMKNRLAGKSMGGNTTTKKVVAKKTVAKKATVKKTMGKKPAVKTMAGTQNYSDLPDLRVFVIKILPATDTLSERLSITDLINNNRVTLPFGYKGGATAQAITYLNNKGIKLIGGQYLYLVTKNMNISIK